MTTTTCHWHTDRETGLRCGRCGKAICVECMRQHPVGVRCKECAREMRLPTYQVSTSYVVRGVAAAVGLGLVGLGVLYLVSLYLPLRGIFFFIIMAGLGYVVGEGVGAAVNHRRGRPYQLMAAAGVLIATAPMAIGSLLVFTVGAFLNLAGVAIAVIVAWARRGP